jgi:hypothetical protein
MRVGQKNKLTHRWARKRFTPRAAHDQRTQSTYLFGAVYPDGAALVLPACNCEAMQLHLDEIATKVAQRLTRAAAAARTRTQRPGKHLAVHASELVVKPDLQIFRRYCCYAWNTLIDRPWKIMSIARCDWAAVGHSI